MKFSLQQVQQLNSKLAFYEETTVDRSTAQRLEAKVKFSSLTPHLSPNFESNRSSLPGPSEVFATCECSFFTIPGNEGDLRK